MMTLLAAFLEIVRDWNSTFPRKRSSRRALRQAVGSLVCLGRRTLSRIIWTNGGQNRSWGSEYFLHSRCRWEPQQLFAPILKRALPYCTGRYIGVAADDTRLHKTGRCIEQAFFQRVVSATIIGPFPVLYFGPPYLIDNQHHPVSFLPFCLLPFFASILPGLARASSGLIIE
jgi:hypothetical protein